MAAARITQPQSFNFTGWNTLLGDSDLRSIGHNTVLVRTREASIGVILHSTQIVTFDFDDAITLRTGGHMTATTKARMNSVLPQHLRVFAKARSWFVHNARTGQDIPFSEGMIVWP